MSSSKKRVADAQAAFAELMADPEQSFCLGREHEFAGGAIFPGAFDPLHDGHRRIATVAGELLNTEVAFEISIDNVDKPSLGCKQVARRIEQFGAEHPIWLTRAATFVDKSLLFPGATFIVGADTITRLVMPRYYGEDIDAVDEAIEKIRRAGCTFLVFGRLLRKRFRGVDEVSTHRTLQEICQQVPESSFRMDISSTELRAK